MIIYVIEYKDYQGFWRKATPDFRDLDQAQGWVKRMTDRAGSPLAYEYRILKRTIIDEVVE